MMAEPFAPYAGIEGAALTGGEGGDMLQKLLMGVLQGTVQIPKHVIDAAAQAAPPGLRRQDVTDIPGSAQPVDPMVAQATQTGFGLMGTAAPMAAGLSKAGEVSLGIVPVDAGRAFGIPSKIPDSDTFRRAVANTPGAAVDAEAMTLPLMRRQHPDQELAESVRGGVFYQPKQPGAYSYTGKNGYGGSDLIEGETAIKAPLFVKGATGGKAPEAAYDSLIGKGAYQDMRTDALKAMGPMWGAKAGEKEGLVRAFLEKHAPELADNAYDIIRNSGRGNQLPYALQEAAVASAARKHGHDAIVGYSTRKGPEKDPFISEVFDTRESHYPSSAGDYRTWPASMFGGKVGALGQPAETIRSAAIRHGNKVFEGALHSDAYEAAAQTLGRPFGEIIGRTKPQDSGFMTSSGRFVTRDEALKIAQQAKQVGAIKSELAAEHFDDGVLGAKK